MPSIGRTGQTSFPRLPRNRTCGGNAKIDANDPKRANQPPSGLVGRCLASPLGPWPNSPALRIFSANRSSGSGALITGLYLGLFRQLTAGLLGHHVFGIPIR